MNVYGITILATILVNQLLDWVADWLNLQHLKPALPEELRDTYDAEKYHTSQAYVRANTRFGFLGSAVDLVVMLAFWFSGGFGWLDALVRSLGYGEIVTGLLFIGILSAANSLISLPFSLYSTFVIEARFGFNKTTWGTFWLDRIKGLALGLLVGAPLLAAILWLLGTAGDWGWLYGWLVLTAFSLLMQYLAPTWIMPLFNKFEPISEDHPLKQSILQYADRVGFPLTNILVMDGSKRSTKSNAFFTGMGKNRRIALFDTLIEQQTVPELTAVVAHEVGHYQKKHIIQGTITSILHTGVMFFLLSVFLREPGLFEAFGVAQPSVYAGLLFFGMLFQPIEMILGMVMNVLSRKHEFEADAFAVETTPEPEALISALKKLSVHNLSNLTPHPFYVFLHYSHPPLLQRLTAIRRQLTQRSA